MAYRWVSLHTVCEHSKLLTLPMYQILWTLSGGLGLGLCLGLGLGLGLGLFLFATSPQIEKLRVYENKT